MANKKIVEPVLDANSVKDIASRMESSIKIQNSIYLADRKRVPDVAIFPDADQYFDPERFAIHLGMHGPTEIFRVSDEETYVAGLLYLFGHENQHVRSTATVPYNNGVKRSAQVIIQYIADKLGIRKNFRNDNDYDVFVKTTLPSHGVHISLRVLMQVCAHLMNSLEDGRIERIRSVEFPGFEKQRRYFRALFWDVDMPMKPYADMDASDRLDMLINAILVLATTGLYPKGFVATYGSTPLMDEVRSFMPYIAKAVLATRTRHMADNAVEIAKLLAPYIYEVSKYDPSKAQQAFEEMLAKMLAALLSEMDISKMAPTSEKEEEQDDGMPMPVFPMSDLVITLDDETYDKLMEKASKNGNGGAGLMIKREHPKEEEKKDGEDSKNGSGSGSDSNPKDEKDSQQSGGGKNADGQDDKESKSHGQSGGKDSDQNGNQSNGSDVNGDGENGDNSNNSSKNSNSNNSSNSQSASQNSNQPYDKTYSRSESGGVSDGKSEQGSHQSGGGEGGSIEMVLDQMKQAATECRSDVSEIISNINQAIEHTAGTNRGNAPIINNTDKPITAEEVKDICSRGFEEKKRLYKLDQPLPAVLNNRAKSFRKKNERYFKSLCTPNVSHLDSGSVDPSRIFGLALGDTNVFRKIGQDRKFNGCVYVLVDNSGSMAGNKRMEAAKAAAVIEEGFKGIIPMKIVAFDTCGPIIHEVIKGWDESQKLNCCWNFAKHGRSGCGNDDAKDILIAQRELMSRPEEKKLLIVLSDGAPSSINQTKDAIAATRKKGISVYGIYFEEGRIGADANEFKYMYEKDYVCCKLDEVDDMLTKLMIKFSRS